MDDPRAIREQDPPRRGTVPPSQRVPLFLLGSGRSGTTLVQRVLNSYPEVTIWGEHAGFLTSLAEAFFTLRDAPTMDANVYQPHAERGNDRRAAIAAEKLPTRWQAWFNWFDRGDLPALFREYLESVFLPAEIGATRIWGFKEIRYGMGDRVVELLNALYPEARFVFVARNGLNTVESQLTTFHQGESRWLAAKRILQLPTLVARASEWASQNRALLELHRSTRYRSHWVSYDDLVADPSCLEPVLADLGLELGEQQLEVFRLREGRGSSEYPGTAVGTRWKRMGPVGLTLAEWVAGPLNAELGYAPPPGRRWVTSLRRALSGVRRSGS